MNSLLISPLTYGEEKILDIKQPAYPAPAFAMTSRSLADISDLIIHHSDGPSDQDPLAIDQEHRNEGWSMIGYDYIIAGNGTIYKGRPDDVVPSAAYGRNAQSVDVCLLGDFQPNTPGFASAVPAAQLQAVKDLSVYLHQRYPSIARTIGHRDVAKLFYPNNTGDYATSCPGDVLEAQLPAIKEYVLAKIQH